MREVADRALEGFEDLTSRRGCLRPSVCLSICLFVHFFLRLLLVDPKVLRLMTLDPSLTVMDCRSHRKKLLTARNRNRREN